MFTTGAKEAYKTDIAQVKKAVGEQAVISQRTHVVLTKRFTI